MSSPPATALSTRKYYSNPPSPHSNYRGYHSSPPTPHPKRRPSISALTTANTINSAITAASTAAVPPPSATADPTTLSTGEHRSDSPPHPKLRPRLPSSTPTTLALSSHLRLRDQGIDRYKEFFKEYYEEEYYK